MTYVFHKRVMGQRDVPVGYDAAIAAIAMPPRSTLNSVNLDVSGTLNGSLDKTRAAGYSIGGAIIPVTDPDTYVHPDTLWDRFVTKDVVADAGGPELDTDTGSVTAGPTFELGEYNLGSLIDVGQEPQMIFNRDELTTHWKNGQLLSDNTSVHGAVIKSKVTKSYRVSVPSVCVFAWGVPDFPNMPDPDTQDNNSFWVPGSELEWTLLTYIDYTVERAFLYLAGMSEEGSTTLFDDASGILVHMLEDAYEDDAGWFENVEWIVISDFNFSLSIEGMKPGKHLSLQNN